MPTLTRWHIKSAFLYLAIAFLLAALLALARVLPAAMVDVIRTGGEADLG
jgi:hypothetical protein